MSLPFAYFLTWSTYATRLHGDPRGSVDDLHNIPGTPVLDADPDRAAREGRLAAQPAMILSIPMRRVVRGAIIEHCPYRATPLLALAVRSNHVHLVVRAADADPGRLEGRFKARATRCLREAGLVDESARVWTARGSTRYVWSPAELAPSVDYVLNKQGERDEFTVRGSGLHPSIQRIVDEVWEHPLPDADRNPDRAPDGSRG